MFSLFDPTGRGHISHEQYDNGEEDGIRRQLTSRREKACG